MKPSAVIFILLVVFVSVNDAGRRFGGFGGGSRAKPPKISQPHSSNTHFINRESSHSSPNHAYPPSSGISGNHQSNTGGHSYPSSNNGLSGNRQTNTGGSGHSYPASNGYSGSNNVPGKGGHSYPGSQGLSGTNAGYQPSYYRPLNSQQPAAQGHYAYHPGAPAYGSPGYSPVYSAGVPQYGAGGYNPTFVNYQTRSGSSVNDLIVGLSVLNLARSFTGSSSQRVDHYYHNAPNNQKAANLTNCTLQLTKEGDGGVVQIPCEYVSSFTNSSEKNTSSTENDTLTDCTISITRNGRVEKTNVSCATLAQLAAKEASPPAGTLNCTQEEDAYRSPFGFTPCKMAQTLKEPEVPLEVLPLKVSENNTTTTLAPSSTNTTESPTSVSSVAVTTVAPS